MNIKPRFNKGDFLKDERGNIFICNDLLIMPMKYIGSAFCVLFSDGTFSSKPWLWESFLTYNATMEEKQKLLETINKHGYVWNTEKLELVEIL